MITSSNIETNKLIDYPIEDRFLMFDIGNLFEVEGIEPIPPQCSFINAINDPTYRFISACLSRRTGKTHGANRIAFCKLLEPGTSVLIISPNYSLSNISWEEQRKLMDHFGIERKKENAKDKEMILENGSFLKLASVGMANSAVGRSYDLVLFDECALDDRGREAFNVVLRPTLDKMNSKAIFISTPRGHNYFKEFFDRGWDDEFPEWFSVHSTWRDNPRASEKDIKQARRDMSRAEFEQEYEANFTVFEGQIYEDFDSDTHVADLSQKEFSGNYWDTIMGVDPGYKDATGAVVIKYDYDEDIFYLIEDYQVAAKNTEDHAKVFHRMIEEYEVDILYCDSAAAQFRMDLSSLYDVPSTESKKAVNDGIMYVQSLLQQDKLIIDSSCTYVIEMLINYRWDPRENLIKSKPLHDKYSHVADALRYALYSFNRV